MLCKTAMMQAFLGRSMGRHPLVIGPAGCAMSSSTSATWARECRRAATGRRRQSRDHSQAATKESSTCRRNRTAGRTPSSSGYCLGWGTFSLAVLRRIPGVHQRGANTKNLAYLVLCAAQSWNSSLWTMTNNHSGPRRTTPEAAPNFSTSAFRADQNPRDPKAVNLYELEAVLDEPCLHSQARAGRPPGLPIVQSADRKLLRPPARLQTLVGETGP